MRPALKLAMVLLVAGMFGTTCFMVFLASSAGARGDAEEAQRGLAVQLGRTRTELGKARADYRSEKARREALFAKSRQLIEAEVDKRKAAEEALARMLLGGAGAEEYASGAFSTRVVISSPNMPSTPPVAHQFG